MIKLFVRELHTGKTISTFEFPPNKRNDSFKLAKLLWNSKTENIRIKIMEYTYNGRFTIGHYCTCSRCKVN